MRRRENLDWGIQNMFQKDFAWGVATSAYQIEGAAFEGGRGLSVWDTFCRQPGKIFEGHTGDVACDHYHRFREDVALMAELGVKAYRFSICWPRVIPDGTGAVNEEGIRFYSDLIDELLAHNITPFVTMFHWDYPVALYHRGGWLNPESPKWFAQYAELLAKRFGDRVKHWMTLNEPQCFIGLAHIQTVQAPGVKVLDGEALQMAHNVMLAHGLAVQAVRANVPGSIVGYAPTSVATIPATDSQADVDAARDAYMKITDDDWNWHTTWWSDPVILGRYPEDGMKRFEKHLGFIKPDDFKIMCQPLDFLGQNIYRGNTVRHTEDGFAFVDRAPGAAKTANNWNIDPQALYWAPKFLQERYHLPIVITENGMTCHDAVSLDGKVHDPNRINYLARYLHELRRASDDGVDIMGYFQWSLMDNFEWADGYNERFGIVYVDYETQKRIPKDSFYWYQKVISENGANL